MDSQNDECVGSNSGQDNEEEQIYQHSVEQVIEKLEEVFNQMPNPGNHVIEELSEELGLDETQVKIWFYNKRCYVQAQKNMEDHEIIHMENNRLYSENLQMYYELTKQFCATCNNYEQQQKVLQDLQNENAKLREEVTLISNMVNHLKEDPEKYLLLLKQNHLHHYNDPNGLDLELRLGCYDDPNGVDLELRLGYYDDPNGLDLELRLGCSHNFQN